MYICLMKEIIFNKKMHLYLFIIYSILIVTLIPLKSILNPQLYGEDEALTYLVNINILDYLSNYNLKGLLSELIKDWHPPGRNLLSLLSISVFGENITSLRIPYYILWMCTCGLGILITKNFSNTVCCYICVTLLAGSGLFHIQTMGFGHGFISFIGMLVIYLIVNKNWFNYNEFSPRKFIYLSIILYIGFLFFNALILITMMLHFVQLFLILRFNNRSIHIYRFFLISSFISFFYIIYFIIFLGLPMLMVNSPDFIIFLKTNFNIYNFGNWKGENFGQYFQYIHRNELAKLNVKSFISNIKYLNWHFYPFLSLFIIIMSFFVLSKSFKIILFLILPYFLITNFYMFGNTGQHFASLFIWLIPFFSIGIYKLAISCYSKNILCILLICFIIPFTLFAHIKSYNETNYPYKVQNNVYGEIKWPPNLYRPLEEMSQEIIKNITLKDHIGFTIDGALTLYYLKDYTSSYILPSELVVTEEKDQCKKLSKKFKVLILKNYSSQTCQKYIKKILTFDNTQNTVIILK